MGDFEVDTSGRCFLCINKVSSLNTIVQLEPESGSTLSSEVHSLQYLSRYVKLDMSKVFSEGTDVPPDLLAKVAKARLKVELCEDCRSVIQSFSKLYRQLERIELEMSSHIHYVHRKLTEATEAITNSKICFENTETFKIAEALRDETKQKCFRKLNAATGPKVRMQKWSTKQINAKRCKIQLNPLRQQRGQKASISRGKNTVAEEAFGHEASATVISTMKEEYSASHLQEDDDPGNDYLDESANVASEDMEQSPSLDSASSATMIPFSNINMAEEPEATASNYSSKEIESMFIREGRSFKCKDCSKRFCSKSIWLAHYKSIHLKILYKCKLCGMEFNQKGNYTRHHQSVHMGVKFKCLVCNKTFSQKGDLARHQKKRSCKRRGKT